MFSLILSFFLFFQGKPLKTNDLLVDMAIKLGKRYDAPRKDYIVLIDYSKSIYDKRLYVIRTSDNSVVMESTVSHGINSGSVYATSFSNEPNTLKSSLGAYITKGTYYGHFGYSLRLIGLDRGINDRAADRMIIFHSDRLMHTKYSWGCFATPEEVNRRLIDLIKNGCLVYVFNKM